MATTLASPPTLAEAEKNIQEAEKIAALWREIADVLRRTNGHAPGNGHAAEVRVRHEAAVPGASEDASPRGRGAIRLIVAERPGMWSFPDLMEEMKNRGWFTSRKGLEVAVTRLVLNGEAKRVDKGRYEFPAPNGKEGAIESPTSGVA